MYRRDAIKRRGGGQTAFRTAKDAGVTIVPHDRIGRRLWERALQAKEARRRANAIAVLNAGTYDMRPRLVKP